MYFAGKIDDQESGAAGQSSAIRIVSAYVAIAFAFSCLLWIVVVKAHGSEPFLYFGSAGPAVAAIILSFRGQPNPSSSRILQVAWFVAALALCWIVISLFYHWRGMAGFSLRLDSLLIFPAILPAWILSCAFARDIGVRALIRRLVHPPNRWTLIALLSFPALQLIPAAIAHLFGGRLIWPGTQGSFFVQAAKAVLFFIFNLLFTAVMEEPGWRGFLLDRLQSRYSPLMASLMVWLPWSLWHGPLDYYRPIHFSFVVWVLLRVVTLIPITIILTWLFNRSTRSIQTTAVFHASMNTCPFVLPYSQPGMALLFVWAAYAVISSRMWQFGGAIRESTHAHPTC